jgi:hypothetical protein
MIGYRYMCFPLRERTSMFVVEMLLSCKEVGQLVILFGVSSCYKKMCLRDMKDAGSHSIVQCGVSS